MNNMFDLDHWQEIYHALTRNKLRTCLTAFGVFWGIFMLMVMLGSGNGLENGATRGFSDSATNSFFVWSQSTTKPYRGLPAGRRIRLSNEDTLALKRQIPEAKIIAPRNQLGGYRGGNNVTRGSKSGAFSVMGDYPEILLVDKKIITSGRFLNQLDLEQNRKVAVIGTRVQDLLFEDDEDPLGKQIRINGVYFKVVGSFRSTQGGEDGDEDTQTIFVPFTTFQRAFNYGDRVGWFAITSADNVPASVAEARVLEFLKKRHRIHPDDRRGLGHFNLEEEYNEVQGLFLGIRTLIWIVGIGTLAAGVIGVSNIMLIIVRERTNEIGIRRALGATPLSVIVQIVLEAIVLTAVAGCVGLMAGAWLMEGINFGIVQSGAQPGMFANPGINLTVSLQALAILIASGVLAGLMPAQRAVRINPVAALRSE